MAFGESVDPTAAIRGVLDSYPFSVGLFRELLQNSDDASASKQVWALPEGQMHYAEMLSLRY